MKRFLILGLLSLFFLSCQKGGSVVTPGTGSLGSLAFSKTCSNGSFQIYKSSVIGGTGYSQISTLSVGASVSVQGVINNSSCHSGASVSFTCKGTVAIDTNRAIKCTSGTIQSNSLGRTSSSQVTTATTTIRSFLPNILNSQTSSVGSCDVLSNPSCAVGVSTTTPRYGSNNLTSGQIHTYDNGTKAYVTIQFPHPSVLGNQYGQHICSAGFTCP